MPSVGPRPVDHATSESNDPFSLQIDSTPHCAIILLDTQGVVTAWSAGAQRVYGYEGQEILGSHVSTLYTEEAIAQGLPQNELDFAVEHGSAAHDGWGVRKDRTRFWASVSVTAIYVEPGKLGEPIGFANVTQYRSETMGSPSLLQQSDESTFDKHEALLGYVMVVQDISERRKLEETVLSARRMNQFLATLAHELRNPLAPLFSATSIMELCPEDASLVRANLGIVGRQLRHLGHLVDDLLDVGRIATGRLELRRAIVQMRSVIAAAVEGSTPGLTVKAQRLQMDHDEATFHVFGDITRLSQALQNVINNASKFSPQGSTIALTCEVHGRTGVISVVDEGCGIDAEFLPGIFQLFAQASPPGHTVSGGLGIGLSLCKSIVEMHGGSIDVFSPGRGHGCTVVIRLPIAMERVDLAAPAATPSNVTFSVLIVDDNRDAADSIGQLLEMSGHDVLVAYDGASALQKILPSRPDVAIIDLAMPDMDGFELVGKLKGLAHLRGTRFYALTGFSESSVRDDIFRAGFDRHLVKPIDIDVLLQILSTDIARAAQQTS